MKTIHFIMIVLCVMSAPVSLHAGAAPGTDLSAQDWSSIRGACEAARHAVRKQENGTHAARNDGQQWHVAFDRRGFLVVPDHGRWTWGLELDGTAINDSNNSAITAGNRIIFRRGETLDEWFVNDRRGLEQGWTLHRAMSAEAVPHLEFKVRGGLIPRNSADGHSVTFQTSEGSPAVVYGGLKAWDATGKEVDVGFVPCENPTSLSIRVDDRGAIYPITIDPIAQQAYLKASNTQADDRFGSAVAISGNTLVVGAPGEDSNATGVNGNQADNSISGSGAAYVFVSDGSGNWTQQAYLKASNTGAFDSFGFAVSISGDTIIVSANAEDSNATGVNGDGSNNSKADSGAAYVFVRNGTTWSQQAYLKASNTTAGDEFGYSVAVSGDTAVVGSFWENTGGFGSGAAYVFVRSGTNWSQQAFLKASNVGAGDHFGTSVAISADTLIVGSILEDSNATGVNGNQSNEDALDSGAAYVFVRSGTAWSQQAYLKASNTDTADYFGWSVAISGDTAVVGAEREDSGAQPFAGAAYIFARNGSTWNQQAYLKSSDGGSGDRFGKSVAVSGGKVIVGANTKFYIYEGMPAAGRAYVFTDDGLGNWSELTYLNASNPFNSTGFGISVAISDDLVIVGGNNERSASTGVNGDQNDTSATGAGAAYLINLNVPAIADIAVEQPSGTALTSGVSSVDFGTVNEFESVQLDFVIRSTGTIDLGNLAVSITPVTGEFTVTTPPSTLTAGSNTTVTVYFTPQGGGTRNATLSITSDDPDESPFEIALTGEGVNAAWNDYYTAVNNAGHFGAAAEPNAKPFHDGVPNLVKYAFNMNLAAPDTHTLAPAGNSGLPTASLIEESGQQYWQFRFVQNLSNGLIYRPVKSTDLEVFEDMAGGLNYESIDDVWYRVTILEPVDTSLTPKLFFRVEVKLP